ncbi:MAG: hypothetical protein Q9168_002800 [Polycauliona sp. 1 TL-2023]
MGRINQSIDWFPCSRGGTLPVQCANLTVLLDYVNATSNATLNLQLVKVSAVKRPKKGSILFNPGGPGAPGRAFVAGPPAASLLIATGGYHDLIGFDPRLTGLYSLGPLLNSSDTAIGQTWAAKTVFAETCHQKAKEVGELIGTGYVARDMMQIVDALGEDGLLRYWGFSYGTLLGQTVAAIFPDRMDKIVLDGCLNPHAYYAGVDVEQATKSDESFEGFFTACVARPEACPLARDGSTAADLEQEFYDLLYSLKYQPYVSKVDGNATRPWPILATGLHGLLMKNDTVVAALGLLLPEISEGIYQNGGLEAYLGGIRASDVRLRTESLASLYPILEQFFNKSQILGDILSANLLTYAQWPFRAKGGYTGDFRVKTRYPLLFIGSDRDPLTPLVSAQNASAGFEGSVVLQHGGHGHTPMAQPSLCTAQAIRAYFVNGTLPAPATHSLSVAALFLVANLILPTVVAHNFNLHSLLKRQGCTRVESECLGVGKDLSDCLSYVCGSCSDIDDSISKCCALTGDLDKIDCLNKNLGSGSSGLGTDHPPLPTDFAAASNTLDAGPFQTTEEPAAVQSACSALATNIISCDAATTGFSYLTAWTDLASCFCYSASEFAPQSFDDPYSTCLSYVETADTDLYSSLTVGSGVSTPCAAIGDVKMEATGSFEDTATPTARPGTTPTGDGGLEPTAGGGSDEDSQSGSGSAGNNFVGGSGHVIIPSMIAIGISLLGLAILM